MAVPSPTTSALLPQVVNENLFQSLSGALKDAHKHVTLFRNIDGGNIGRVLPKYLSQWITEHDRTSGWLEMLRLFVISNWVVVVWNIITLLLYQGDCWREEYWQRNMDEQLQCTVTKCILRRIISTQSVSCCCRLSYR
ncbi:uncharacterized protein LOC124204728 [Daphnia pulex]|uniref:uncharacterized protein LOC124204728 n=1 Tax=Daphnia pulex TaxID=6669 RepID=UPI001EDD5977|nr:uncharacterized protein LOC124204728 [Daphnia pulex]